MIRNWTLRHGRITGQPTILTLTKLVRSITIIFRFFGLPALMPHIAFLLPGSPPSFPPLKILSARAGSALMWVLLSHRQGAINDGYYFSRLSRGTSRINGPGGGGPSNDVAPMALIHTLMNSTACRKGLLSENSSWNKILYFPSGPFFFVR
jgi:hypothetical protein